MTDKEKLEKIKALADKMYSRMAYLTSDPRPIRQAMDEYHQFIINEYHKENPVNEDLKKCTSKIILEGTNFNKSWFARPELAFTAGAKWQKEQMEAYRIEHCKSLTNEQAELEDNFVSSHVEKNNRIPTFIDAIEYGMEYCKQQMMANAVDGTLSFGELAEGTPIDSIFVLNKEARSKYKDSENVKLIVIKEG